MISHEPQSYQILDGRRTVHGRGEQFAPVIAALAHVRSLPHLVRRAATVAVHASAGSRWNRSAGTVRNVDGVPTGSHLVAREQQGSELAESQDMRRERLSACGALCEVGLSADGRVR